MVLDALTYAGNLASLEPVRAHPELHLRPRRHHDTRAGRGAAADPRGHDAGALRRRVARGPLDRGARRLPRDQHQRDPRAAQGGPQVWLDGPGRERFHHVSTDEVYGSLGAGRSAVHRDQSLRAQLALRGQQGRLGSPGAGVSPHVRPAGHHQQLLQQLRAAAVSREADPAHAGERAGGEAAAGLRRRAQRARLAVRGGPLPGGGAGRAAAGRVGETYNVGGWSERTNLDVVRLLCRLVDEAFAADTGLAARFPRCPAARGGDTGVAAHLRGRPSRPRPPLCHRCGERSRRSWGSARRRASRADFGGRSTGTSTTSPGGGRRWTAATQPGSSDGIPTPGAEPALRGARHVRPFRRRTAGCRAHAGPDADRGAGARRDPGGDAARGRDATIRPGSGGHGWSRPDGGAHRSASLGRGGAAVAEPDPAETRPRSVADSRALRRRGALHAADARRFRAELPGGPTADRRAHRPLHDPAGHASGSTRTPSSAGCSTSTS